LAIFHPQKNVHAQWEKIKLFIYYTQTIIHILIINFIWYFKGKINDLVVKISPSTKRYKVQSFSQFVFFSMDEMNEKKKI